MKPKETETEERRGEEPVDSLDMKQLSRALGQVKAKKAALDAAVSEMTRVITEQQMHVNAAQAAHEEAQRAAEVLHEEFRGALSVLLPSASRTRTA